MPPVFAHGALRLYLLALLESGPKHGYELIKALSERFGGTYSPSAGTIYPRLGKLEEEGLVATRIGGPPHQLQHHRGRPGGTEQPRGTNSPASRTTFRPPSAGWPTTSAQDIRGNMRGLRADLAATAEAARSAATSARRPRRPRTAVLPGGRTAGSRKRKCCCRPSGTTCGWNCAAGRRARPVTPVTLETVRTVLDQARISIRNSLRAKP